MLAVNSSHLLRAYLNFCVFLDIHLFSDLESCLTGYIRSVCNNFPRIIQLSFEGKVTHYIIRKQLAMSQCDSCVVVHG